MTPTSLQQLLTRIESWIDADALPGLMAGIVRAAKREQDGLVERVPHEVRRLTEATSAARARAEEVASIDRKTRGGILGTLLSSADAKGTGARRQDAARALAGDLAVVEVRVEDARALVQHERDLIEVARRGEGVLTKLQERAFAADLEASLAATIPPARAAVAALPRVVRGVSAPLDGPVRSAEAVAHEAAGVLAALRGGGRAATIGEAMLDGLVGPDTGALGQRFRRGVADAAPGLVPDLEREILGGADGRASVASERDGARQRARRDAEARRAAMAELDDLDMD